MVKRFSTMRDNQRGSQSYMKNRRGRKEIEVSTEEGDRGEHEERKGDSRGERQIYTVICSQSVLRSPDTKKIHRIGLGREGEWAAFLGAWGPPLLVAFLRQNQWDMMMDWLWVGVNNDSEVWGLSQLKWRLPIYWAGAPGGGACCWGVEGHLQACLRHLPDV